jgi:hypothetical protein
MQLKIARSISQQLQHQQLPHSAWDTLCLSLRVLSTAAAASVSETVQQHSEWAHSSCSSSPRSAIASSTAQHSCSLINHAASSAFASAGRSTARVLDGKAVAAAWSSELQEQVQDISRVLNRRPGLAVVLVGNRPDSLIYVSRKQEACK